MNRINVSIIIPAYNNAKYIRDSLESVFSQTYDSYEVLVIDDGSTDNTQAVLQPYLKKIRYTYQNHSGVASARNRGLTMTKGKYVAFLDADDFFSTDKLLKQVTFLDDHPEIGIVHGGWYLIDNNKKFISVKKPWQRASELNLETWLIWQPIFLGAMMFRRSWLEKTGEFNTELTQASDLEFLLRLAVKGCPGAWVKKPMVYYRQHGGGLTGNSLKRVLCVNKVIEDFFLMQGLPKTARQLEKKVRYQILMWSVWLLYRSGNKEQINDYLRKTLKFLSDSPKHIIHGWLIALLQHCRSDRDCEIEELQNFWPYFKEVIPGQETTIASSEKLFYWLLKSEIQLKSTMRKGWDDR